MWRVFTFAMVLVFLLGVALPGVAAGGSTDTWSGDALSSPPDDDLVDTETIIKELKKLGFSEAEIAEVVDALTLKTPSVPKGFVDPVTLVVKKVKSQGKSDSEIVKALRPLGMGYYPPTGATWRGRAASPEELGRLPQRTSLWQDQAALGSSYKREAGMYTLGWSWSGIEDDMQPGSLAIQQGQTTDHDATTHWTDGSNWAEVGVFRFLANPNWRFFTYDNDEGLWGWHGNTSAGTYSHYLIYRTPSVYNIWINYGWVRSGTTPSSGRVFLVKEAWSDTNVFTDDTQYCYFKNPKLYPGYGQPPVNWDRSISDDLYQQLPIRVLRWIENGAWKEQIWVQN